MQSATTLWFFVELVSLLLLAFQTFGMCMPSLLFGGQLVATDCEGDIHIGVAATAVTALLLLCYC